MENTETEYKPKFNVVKFYETLAKILSEKHGVEITVEVTRKPGC